jgi:uncharacterized membrane protein required for colicin V production
MKFAFILSLSDFLILGVIAFFAFSGFMRGALRALFSTLRVYFSFIITTFFYERAALPLQAILSLPSWLARMISFIFIFGLIIVLIWLIGAIVIKRISKPPPTGNALDKIAGIILGVIEGVLITSIIIMCINFYPGSSETSLPMENSITYRFVKSIAPSIKNFTMGPISRLREEVADEPKSGNP